MIEVIEYMLSTFNFQYNTLRTIGGHMSFLLKDRPGKSKRRSWRDGPDLSRSQPRVQVNQQSVSD